MSILVPGNDGVRGTDGLASAIVGKVEAWAVRRDMEYRSRWQEYYRLWKGIWSPEDRDRISERSHAIMPAIAQAVDSAVAEQEEATFGRLRWFDVVSEAFPQVADMALEDLRMAQADVARVYLLGAIYGTGIGKVVITGDAFRGIRVSLVAIEPGRFVIDPAAETIDEAEGVAHQFILPRHVVLERQKAGIYAKIDPGTRPDAMEAQDRKTDELALQDTDAVEMIEWHGLVERKMLPASTRPDSDGKLDFEDDELVESIVTIANRSVVLKAVPNPLEHQDRAFIAYQHDTVPGRFWGRGIVEKGYWPQKVLDSEIRARIDALGFSTHPMMAINAAAVPRNTNFKVRPGANVFLNGAVSDSIAPLNFPPPDPQTYQQSSEMQRMVEMATGQLQAATPLGVNARNSTASGMSMILGAQIRRTKRTMANIERDFLRPLVKKSIWRLQQFDERYPAGEMDIKVFGTLGIMAREFEQMQLSQMLNALPPGPQSLLVMRAIIDNGSLVNKEAMLQMIDLLIQQSMQPQEPPPDLAGQARLLSAQVNAQKTQHDMQMDEVRAQLEEARIRLQQASERANHERGLMAISVESDKAEAAETRAMTGGILDLAKAEGEALAKVLAEVKTQLASMPKETAGPVAADAEGASSIEELRSQLTSMKEELERSKAEVDDRVASEIAPIQIERDSNGLVSSVNGRVVVRDENGQIVRLQ